MCFDPVSLGMAALGTGSSVLGGIMNQDAQTKQLGQIAQDNANAATVSNAVLSKFEDTQKANQDVNNATLAKTYAFTDPAAFGANQDSIASDSTNNAKTAIGALLAGQKAPALTGTDNGQTANEIAMRTGVATGKSIRDATNSAKLGAYGTNFAQLGLKEADSARGIDTMNQTARGQAGVLKTDEDNAALQARRYIAGPNYGLGTALQGLGNIFASAGGSGYFRPQSSTGPNIGNPGLSNPMSLSNGGIG